MKHDFYLESGVWYIDLPEFIAAGLGGKPNLMMVAGADTFLDMLSDRTGKVSVHMESEPFDGFEFHLLKMGIGMDKPLLDSVGHPDVEYGAYYQVVENSHELWLCPVTEYVFGGGYPKDIYIKVI